MRKKVILIGGGHGLSNLVKGFKDEDVDLSIVVASSDDGGHTGEIRKEFGTIAMGDLRRILNEFIKEDSFLGDFFDYRFNFLHGIENVSLGNLIITALLEKYRDIDKVIECFRNKLGILANIYLASNNPLTLCAKCVDGEVIKGEHVIGKSNKNINSLYMEEVAVCNKEMIDNLECADIIVLTPGSLYTSIGAVLCVEQIKEAINNSKATIIYVCNIMTQNGETFGYSVGDHVRALEDIMGRSIDRVIINNGKIDEVILKKYKEENSDVIGCEKLEEKYEFYDLVEIIDGKVRHNGKLVQKIILGQ